MSIIPLIKKNCKALYKCKVKITIVYYYHYQLGINRNQIPINLVLIGTKQTFIECRYRLYFVLCICDGCSEKEPIKISHPPIKQITKALHSLSLILITNLVFILKNILL